MRRSNYYQEDVNDFNISKIMVYYHWVIDEFVIEYDGMFMGYCSSIIEQYPIKSRLIFYSKHIFYCFCRFW